MHEINLFHPTTAIKRNISVPVFACAIVIQFLLFSCHPKSIDTPSAYLKWIHDDSHGLTQSREINGYRITVKYLPGEYLTYKELQDKVYTGAAIDSLKKKYESARTFLLTIARGEGAKNANDDIMYDGVTTYKDYASRSHVMNYEMEKLIRLKAGAETFAPVLATLENTYSAAPFRTIYLVFAESGKATGSLQQSDLTLTFDDRIFGTGENTFPFSKNDLAQVPQIAFWKPYE